MLEQEKFIGIISDIIRQARRNNNYTLDRLAENSSTDYSTVSLIENGKQNPRLYTLYRILYALGIDIVELLNKKSRDAECRKTTIINRLQNQNMETLESVYELVEKFNISRKI